mgnify:CR=1 FL=1
MATGINEYELNLAVSLKVRDILEERGYDVYMIRETHDVISAIPSVQNLPRRTEQTFSCVYTRTAIRTVGLRSTHDGTEQQKYVSSGDVISKSQKLSQKMIAAFCKDTGAKNRDVIYTDSMSGINWSTIPVTIIELGFMSNPSEDRLMATEDYRNKMAQGIADGIDAYYE